jgi:pimeloyl-ACP methyl ester carboxylesterase
MRTRSSWPRADTPCSNPNFAAGAGYCAAHYRAGFKQWGLKMQDDMADGARWAIARGLADQVGHAVFAPTSPLAQAARLKQPLLPAYGGADQHVPIFHGKKFHDAVTKTNHSEEWIEYPEEGHGWYLMKNRVDFWSKVERFLDGQIGAAALPAPAPKRCLHWRQARRNGTCGVRPAGRLDRHGQAKLAEPTTTV